MNHYYLDLKVNLPNDSICSSYDAIWRSIDLGQAINIGHVTSCRLSAFASVNLLGRCQYPSTTCTCTFLADCGCMSWIHTTREFIHADSCLFDLLNYEYSSNAIVAMDGEDEEALKRAIALSLVGKEDSPHDSVTFSASRSVINLLDDEESGDDDDSVCRFDTFRSAVCLALE